MNSRTFSFDISKVSNHHHRTPLFFTNIEKILLFIKDKIKQSLSNSEIFTIFLYNKLVLLILFQQQILIPDQSIANKFLEEKYKKRKYPNYFLPEIRPFISNRSYKRWIWKNCLFLFKHWYNGSEYSIRFEERKIGENERKLNELIQKDLLDEFIIYINEKSIPLSIKIQPPIFETNQFLLKKNPTLIKKKFLTF